MLVSSFLNICLMVGLYYSSYSAFTTTFKSSSSSSIYMLLLDLADNISPRVCCSRTAQICS